MAIPTADSFERADRLFEDALDLIPAERRAFLDRSCAGEPELRALLDRLLADSSERTEADPLLGRMALASGGALAGAWGEGLRQDLARDEETLQPGSEVGRYRVLRELGRGGMAVVYLAERADGEFAQKVAIKVLYRGLGTRELVARFEQERQILAAARHPGIARLLDGGVLSDGHPYLVMEYVEGLPIDRHADQERLTVRARIRTFLQVGRAVEHAHRNLVIHRDLKPSNILVTPEGHAKLLDFGIAKLFDPGAPDDATRTVARLLTPAYASPEQLSGAPVTTASDVYQLGLLLYVLLCGRLPYRFAEGSGAPSAEVARAILETEPLRLTAALAAAKTTGAVAASGEPAAPLADLARARGTSPSRLRRELAGDLETIVATALRKAPERRYGSVALLLADLERYLDGRPIAARPDTLAYRLRKFGARHRGAVATASIALLLLVGLVFAYTQRLRRERDRAERSAAESAQVASFLRGLFAVSAPTRSAGEWITARQLLDQGAKRIDRELATQPVLAADMMTLMGQVYGELALYDESRTLLERAVVLRRRIPGTDGLDLAASLEALARVRGDNGSLVEGLKLYREALKIREAGAARREPETKEGRKADAELGRTLQGMGRVLALQGKYALAAHLHRRAVALLERSLGGQDPDVGLALRDLGFALRRSSQQKEAKPVLERALALLKARYGPQHPYTTETQVELGVTLWGLHDLDGAWKQLEVLPFLIRAYGPEHPKVAFAMTQLGSVTAERGDTRQAIRLLEQALAIRTKSLGPTHPDVGSSLIALGRAYWLRNDPQQGDLQRALGFFERARAILEPSVGADHPDLSIVFDCMGGVYQLMNRLPEARAAFQQAIAVRSKAMGSDSLYLYMPLYSLATLELRMQEWAGAEQTLRRLIELGRAYPSTRHMTAMPQVRLARCLTELRRYAEAEALLLPLAGDRAETPVRREAVETLATLYAAWGKTEPAARYRRLWQSLPTTQTLQP